MRNSFILIFSKSLFFYWLHPNYQLSIINYQLSVSPFAPEVQAHVEVDAAEGVVGGELPLTVVVAVHDGTHAGKPTGVVPYDAKAPRGVKGQVAEREVALGMPVSNEFACRRFVAHRQRHADCCQPIACKDEVVGITAGEGDIGILDTVEIQSAVDSHFAVNIGQLIESLLQLFGVEVDAVSGIGDACQGRAAANPLHRALAEGGGIGKALMVEDIGKVDARDAHIQAREGYVEVAYRTAVDIGHNAADMIVGARLAIVEVDADEVAVEAHVKLFLVVAVGDVADVERIAEEDPPPAEIGSDAVGQVG